MARNITRDENQEETKKCMIGDEVLPHSGILNFFQGLCDNVFHLLQDQISINPKSLQQRWCISHHGSGLRAWQVEKAILKHIETISWHRKEARFLLKLKKHI